MSEIDELQPSSEFEIPLADTPEAEAPDTPEAEAPKKKGANPYVPGQPLPRLWKTEPDPEEEPEESLENSKKKKGSKDKDGAAAASKSPSKPKAVSKPAKPKPKKKPEGEGGQKRVLLEETPALDTIESRQRARMVMGALMVFCVGIFGWIVYGMLFGGSDDLMVDAVEMPPETVVALPGPPPSREPEARYMLDRARDHAKAGHTDQAVAMLTRVVSVYRGTQAGGEAQAALDRTRQNLPLFPDRPYLLAQKTAGVSPPPGATAPPGSAATPDSVRAPGATTPVPSTRPDSRSLPPPEVASSGPPPAQAPGRAKAVTPSPSLNPGTVGAPTTTAPAMSPNVARTAPPPAPNAPAANGGSPPPAPAPGPATAPGPETVARAPAQPQPTPPGPGEAAILVPANPTPPVAMPAAGENSNPGVDRGTPAPLGRVARTLPPGFKAKPEAGLHESGWPFVIVGERDGGTMVLVPGGTFTMGSDSGDPSNRPAHSVRLSTYYIDRHEVTNRQFRTFLAESHYHGHPPGKWLTDEKQRSLPDDAPAVFVSYQDAEEYAIWALKRLPTEAQWEFAARSLDGRRYPWGDQPARWSRPRKFQQIDLVMSYSEDVSPYGVHDLAGNAVEWVRDWYDPRYFDRMRDKTTEDPTGPPTKRQGILRTVKGCSKDWLAFARQGVDSDRRSPSIGFRCSLAVEGGEASAIIAPHPPKPDTPQPGTPPPGGQAPGGNVPF